MQQRLKSAAFGALGLLLVLALAAAVFLFSGVYDVAATSPHTGAVAGLLSTLQEQSIDRHAAPAALPTDSAAWLHGLEHYQAMCVVCHGAPGVEQGEVGRGLNPQPPDLAEEAGELSDAELVWIIEHGIKFTGMPAFGVTHSDEEVRQIAAFVRLLPDLTSGEYARLVASVPAGGHSHSHAAGEGTAGQMQGDGQGAADATPTHPHAPGTPAHTH